MIQKLYQNDTELNTRMIQNFTTISGTGAKLFRGAGPLQTYVIYTTKSKIGKLTLAAVLC
jgi:hypothetical protein